MNSLGLNYPQANNAFGQNTGSGPSVMDQHLNGMGPKYWMPYGVGTPKTLTTYQESTAGVQMQMQTIMQALIENAPPGLPTTREAVDTDSSEVV